MKNSFSMSFSPNKDIFPKKIGIASLKTNYKKKPHILLENDESIEARAWNSIQQSLVSSKSKKIFKAPKIKSDLPRRSPGSKNFRGFSTRGFGRTFLVSYKSKGRFHRILNKNCPDLDKQAKVIKHIKTELVGKKLKATLKKSKSKSDTSKINNDSEVLKALHDQNGDSEERKEVKRIVRTLMEEFFEPIPWYNYLKNPVLSKCENESKLFYLVNRAEVRKKLLNSDFVKKRALFESEIDPDFEEKFLKDVKIEYEKEMINYDKDYFFNGSIALADIEKIIESMSEEAYVETELPDDDRSVLNSIGSEIYHNNVQLKSK